MKKLIFFVLFLCISFSLFCQNLAVNPGLEVWEKVTRPAGWSHVEKCTKDSSEVHSGNYSCKHTGLTSTSDLGQNITIIPGVDYTLSFFYKTGSPSDGKGSRIWCYWKDAFGETITDPATDDIMRPGEYLKSAVWAKFTITIKAPETATTFYLEVRTNSNSMMYWDDFIFNETTPVNIRDEIIQTPRILPVPAHDFIIIRNIQGSHYAEIIDIYGSKYHEYDTRNSDEVRIPVEGLKPGIYLARVIYPQKIIVVRFVKE